MLNQNEELVLEVIDLNNEGAGRACYAEDYPIIVEKTLPGDFIKVKIIKKFSKYAIAELKQVIKPSIYRIEAECKHFSECGGCNLQNYINYTSYKNAVLTKALQRLNFAEILHPMFQVNKNTRRRVSFTINENKISFNKAKSHQAVIISDCLLLEDRINALITPINKLIKKFQGKLTKLNIMSSDTGIELLFISKKKTNAAIESDLANFAEEQNIARIVWQVEGRSPYILIQRKQVQLIFNDIKIDLPINSFLQTSKESYKYISEIILKHLNSSKVIELYCGCGGFTIPIASKVDKVLAIEGNEESVAILKNTIKTFNLSIEVIAQDLFQKPILAEMLNNYPQVVINPPRNGASPQIEQIALAHFVKKVILISCSLENFIRDAKILINNKFKLSDVYPVDQFLYSSHLEIIGIFNKDK